MERSTAVQVTVAAGVAALCYLSWRRLKRRLERKPFDELPMPPMTSLLSGHRVYLVSISQMQQLAQSNVNEQGQMGLWIYNSPVLLVTDWRDASTILRHEYERKRVSVFVKHLSMFLGQFNTTSLSGREWKANRAMVLRSFAPSIISSSSTTIAEVVDRFVAAVEKRLGEDKSVWDVEDLMKMITIDVFGQVALSKDLECTVQLTRSKIAAAFDYLGQELIRRAMAPLSPSNFFYSFPCEANRMHRQERKKIRGFLESVIEERRRSPSAHTDLLTHLLASMDNADDRMVEVLQDTLLTLTYAGYDTTSITLTYAIYLLSQHADVEALVLEEVTRASSLESNSELVYCQAVLMEALRLYPPATSTSRCLQNAVELQGGMIAKPGTRCVVPIWIIQRSERNFAKPDDFRPDRWVKQVQGKWVEREPGDTEGSIEAANRRAFLAFSAGARSCGGQGFAENESVLVLARLMRSLRFKTIDGFVLEPVRKGLVQGPKDGLPMVIEAR